MLVYIYSTLKVLCLVFLLFAEVAFAEDFNLETKPLYEFGLGGGGGFLTDYPGSDQNHWRGVPYPYFIYRGAIFRADQRRGARARLITTQSYELALSGSGSFPANSEENIARAGMPNLDWMGEVGPRVVIELGEKEWLWHLFLNIPVRAVFSTDLSTIDSRGYTFTPSVIVERFGLFHADSRLAFEVQFNFMDQTLAKYFYEVNAPFVRADRPEYMGKAGFMGTDFQVRFLHPLADNVRTYTGLNLSYYAGSVNDNSPLFRSLWGIDVSAGIVWVVGKSKEFSTPD